MFSTADTTIVFTAGRYSADRREWKPTVDTPAATITVGLFRAIFDAVGDQTIDTVGDIDPAVLLQVVGLGPRGAERVSTQLRLACRWARDRSLRIGYDIEQSGTVS